MFSPEFLARARAFEDEWDQVMGGQPTRPYRELAMFCVGRLLLAGAELPDVVGYLEACVATFSPEQQHLEEPPAGNG
jgi:hypothetical protein